MQQYTFQQYEKFFENFEGSNAGLIYKPRTFASLRLEELISAIINNIDNEEAMKKAIQSNHKLGEPVMHFMYDDMSLLNKTVFNSKVERPDFLDAIKIWRDSIT